MATKSDESDEVLTQAELLEILTAPVRGTTDPRLVAGRVLTRVAFAQEHGLIPPGMFEPREIGKKRASTDRQ